MMEEKESGGTVAINIFGGCQQILPNATRAVQNFYGDQFAGERSREEVLERLDLSPEARRLSIYIDDTEALAGYVSRVASCVNASELAVVVMDMVEHQPRVTREEMVRERFIRTLLPLAPRVTTGRSIDNIRARINDAWMKRPKKRP